MHLRVFVLRQKHPDHKREKNVLAKMVGTTIFSMVWWIRLEVTIRGRRVTAGERSSPETIL